MAENIYEKSLSINVNGPGTIHEGLKLYYSPYSYYSQKVLMALHEKKIPFESHEVDLMSSAQYEPWFLRLNPKAEIPVLSDSGKLVTESAHIIDYLEDTFSTSNFPKLIPMEESHGIRQKVTYYRFILDQIPAGVITLGSFFHPEDYVSEPKVPFLAPVRKQLMLAEKNRRHKLLELIEKNPDYESFISKKLEIHEKRHEIITSKKEFSEIIIQIEDVLDKIEAQLSVNQPERELWWLCSKSFSVADISLTVLLERLYQLGMENYFWKCDKRPLIEKYFERVRLRETFKRIELTTLSTIKIFLNSNKWKIIGAFSLFAATICIGTIVITLLT